MGKLYLFGIGGTGSRVIRSLVMLLSAGVKLEVDSIVPVIIDPDSSAGDLTRTVDLMRKYTQVYNKMNNSSEATKFFSSNIEEIVPNYQLNLANTQNAAFKNYINYGGLNQANQALASILFSDDNLNASMEVGFKGNPNIGSVVLNTFTQSPEFMTIANSFSAGDSIFIISSIFGGTGASGFPLLLKNLRTLPNKKQAIPNAQLISGSKIGAISVLPYFGVVSDSNSSIDESTFISKAKAALSYYDRNMGNLDALYYIADNISEHYDNCEGGVNQKNKAHFIELVSALSIVDYTKTVKDDAFQPSTIYKEFSIKEDKQRIIFSDLESNTYQLLAKPLTQFTLFCKYMNEHLDENGKQPWLKVGGFDSNFFSNVFYKDFLESISREFLQWLRDMSVNQRAFDPINIDQDRGDLFALVRGVETKKLMCIDSNYMLFDNRLNQVTKKGLRKDVSQEHRLIELFGKATQLLVDEKIKL
ncbi:MAG: hypothetical protein ACRCUJ_09080 [Phocaeicola sp.]